MRDTLMDGMMQASAWQHRAPAVRLKHMVFPAALLCRPVLRVIVLLVLVAAARPAMAVILDPPAIQCASVDLAGNVTLTWSVPPDPGGDFDRYEIFWATTIAGPFALLATVNNYAQTTFLHAPAGGDNGPRFYYMTTVSSAPPPNTSEPGDTVSTLFLEVFQSVPPGSANIAWNAPAMPAGSASVFNVWMEYPLGNWEVIATVPTTSFSYQHLISICEDSLTFRVELAHRAVAVPSAMWTERSSPMLRRPPHH